MARGVDYLEEDRPIAGQKFFLKSVITGQDGAVYEKIRYVCGTMEDAKRTAAVMIQQNDTFDIAVGEIGKWSPVIPGLDNSEDVEYQDERLNETMKQYIETQKAAKEHFETRKAGVIREGIEAHLEEDEKIPEGLPGPPPPINEHELWEAAKAEAATVHPSERAARGLPEVEDVVLDVPVSRSSGWKAVV